MTSKNNKKSDSKLKIYIAGPDVFAPDDIEMGKKKVEICERYGFEGLYPTFLLPADLFSGKYDKNFVGDEVNKKCIQGIVDCDIIIANITPFRGFEMDSGTAFEVGVARGLNKEIYGYSQDNRTYIERMEQSGGGVFRDKSGVARDKNGFAIEDVNEGENSMISKSCRGIVTPSKGKELTLLELFEKAVIQVKCDLEVENSKKRQESRDNSAVVSLPEVKRDRVARVA